MFHSSCAPLLKALDAGLDRGGDFQIDALVATAARTDRRARVDDELPGLALRANVRADLLDPRGDRRGEGRIHAVRHPEDGRLRRPGRLALRRYQRPGPEEQRRKRERWSEHAHWLAAITTTPR